MVQRRVSRKLWFLAAGAALTAAFCSFLIFAYNPEQDDVNGSAVPATWPSGTVTWHLNSKAGSNVRVGSNVLAALQNAFTTWQTAKLPNNGTAVAQLTITQGPNTTLTNPDPMNATDCVNIVSFVDSNANDFPSGTATVAFTALATVSATVSSPPPFTYSCAGSPNQLCSLQSCIVDADIMFSPNKQFSTSTPTPANAFDIQSVATHEAGHLLGLDHSGIAHTVMYPFGDLGISQQATLAVDDVLGIGFLYPSSFLPSLTGAISGTVTQSGNGIFASHIVVIDATTGNAVADGLTNPDGTFTRLVPPGTYNVLALPLAPNTSSGIYVLDDFGGWSCGYAGVTENSPPCCDPTIDPTGCNGKALSNPTNYTGNFF